MFKKIFGNKGNRNSSQPAHRNSPAARSAIQSVRKHIMPYVDFLPEPSDATINILRQFGSQLKNADKGNKQPFSLGVSSLEAPSARLALDCFLVQIGAPKSVVSVARIPEPDPRLPHGEVDFVLWRYSETEPEVAVAPPSDAVAREISRIAAAGSNIQQWATQTHNLASTLESDHLNDLLGVMVHPPACPGNIEMWNWIHYLQTVSALTIAYLNEEEPWQGSLRRRALLSLVRGPMDWTIEAAIIALSQVAHADQSSAADIIAIWTEMFDNLPSSGAVPYLSALAYYGLTLPNSPENLHKRLEDMRENL